MFLTPQILIDVDQSFNDRKSYDCLLDQLEKNAQTNDWEEMLA